MDALSSRWCQQTDLKSRRSVRLWTIGKLHPGAIVDLVRCAGLSFRRIFAPNSPFAMSKTSVSYLSTFIPRVQSQGSRIYSSLASVITLRNVRATFRDPVPPLEYANTPLSSRSKKDPNKNPNKLS